MGYWDADAFHRGCGGTVKHHHIRATHLDPPEDWLECSICGDIGDGEISESRQEPCEGCGKVLTDCGEMCGKCKSEEANEDHADGERLAAGCCMGAPGTDDR